MAVGCRRPVAVAPGPGDAIALVRGAGDCWYAMATCPLASLVGSAGVGRAGTHAPG
jgi:hypothetical protein